MKKIFFLITAIMLFSPLSYADDYYRQRGNGWGHHEREHHHRHRHYYQPEGRYYQQQPAIIYQQPPTVIYQQQPVYSQPMYYPSNELRLHW